MQRKDQIRFLFLLMIGFLLSISIGLGGFFAGLYFSNLTEQYAILIVSSFLAAILGFLVFFAFAWRLLYLPSVLRLLLWYLVFTVVFTVCKQIGVLDCISWAVLPLYIYALQIILFVHAGIQMRKDHDIHQIPPKKLQKQEMQGYILFGILLPVLFWLLEKQERMDIVSSLTMTLGNIVFFVVLFVIFGLCIYAYVKAAEGQTKGAHFFWRILIACFLCGVISYFSMKQFGYLIGIVCLCIALLGLTYVSIRKSRKFTVPISRAYQEGKKTGDWSFYFEELERLQQEEDVEKIYYVMRMQDGKKYKISVKHYMFLLKIDKLLELGEWQKAEIEIENAKTQIQDPTAQQLLHNEIAYFQKQKSDMQGSQK